MVRQKDIFLEGEGNAWYSRNKAHLGEWDHVSNKIASVIRRKPENVLEIGCSNGWRLAKLREVYGCNVVGVEPSIEAAIAGASLKVPIIQSTASCLPVHPKHFDVVIYGFCLYLTDPDDWLLIAAEGDRVLKDDGYLIIHDWGGFENPPHSVVYKHDPRVQSWHFDFSQLWLAHPQYKTVWQSFTTGRGHPDQQAVTVLHKNRKFA